MKYNANNGSKKPRTFVTLDIELDYLKHIEDIFFKIGLFRETDSVYVRGVNEAIEVDLTSLEYIKFCLSYGDLISTGRPKDPVKIFKLVEVIFDYYQYVHSPMKNFLISDPSTIDDTVILSRSLNINSLLISAANTMDIIIPERLLETFAINKEAIFANQGINRDTVEKIDLLDRVTSIIYKLIEEQSQVFDFSNGKYYKLKLYKGLMAALEKEDIRVARYNNIVAKANDTLTEMLKEAEEENEISEEQIENLLAIRNEDRNYTSALLNRLVLHTEILPDEPVVFKDKEVIQPLNIDVPFEEGEEIEQQ